MGKEEGVVTMAQVIADRRDVDFVLFEQLGVDQFSTDRLDFALKVRDELGQKGAK